MRSNGIPGFPDPTNDGTTLRTAPVHGVDPNSPRYQSARDRCDSLVPRGGAALGAAITPADQLDYLKAAACMRDHGISNFPDPTIKAGQVTFVPPSGFHTNSAQLQTALTICRKLIPAGLPYSN